MQKGAPSRAPFRFSALYYCCGLLGGGLELCPVVSEDAGGIVLGRGAFATLLAGGVLTTGAVVFDAVSVVWLLPPNRNTSISTSTTAPAIQPHMAFEP